MNERIRLQVKYQADFRQALIMAHNKQIAYSEILDRTAGLIFMGTPHRGSDTAKWASMLKEMFNVVGAGSHTHLLADLKRQSRTLIQINSDFVERAVKFQQILSFYELCTTGGLLVCLRPLGQLSASDI